jgi:hypothetical protein
MSVFETEFDADLIPAPLPRERLDIPPIEGSGAVFRGQRVAWLQSLAQREDVEKTEAEQRLIDAYAEIELAYWKEEIDSVRGHLQDLNKYQRKNLDTYLYRYYPEPVKTHPTRTEWLADPEKGADDKELYSFLNSHLEEIKKTQQSPEVMKGIEDIKAQYLSAQEQAVEDGWLHPNARSTMDKARSATVYIGDYWDELIDGVEGFQPHGEDFVVVYQTPAKWSFRIRLFEVLPHELAHLQFDNDARDDDNTAVVIADEDIIPYGLIEAGIEHINLGLMNGDFDILDPKQRTDDGAYEGDRLLLHTLHTMGLKEVEIRDFTLALTSDGMESPEWRKWGQSIKAAWGDNDILHRITNEREKYQKALEAKHPEWDRWRIEDGAALLVRKNLREYSTKTLRKQTAA